MVRDGLVDGFRRGRWRAGGRRWRRLSAEQVQQGALLLPHAVGDDPIGSGRRRRRRRGGQRRRGKLSLQTRGRRKLSISSDAGHKPLAPPILTLGWGPGAWFLSLARASALGSLFFKNGLAEYLRRGRHKHTVDAHVTARVCTYEADPTRLWAVPDGLIGFGFRLGPTIELLDDVSDAGGGFSPSRRFWFCLGRLLSFWTDRTRLCCGRDRKKLTLDEYNIKEKPGSTALG